MQSTPTRGKSTDVNGFDVYRTYIALKLHFTKKSYDFFKFNGKTSVTLTSFQSRRDRHIFEQIAKRYKKEYPSFLLSNYTQIHKSWIGDLMSDESKNIYTEWLKRRQSLTQSFKDDVSVIVREMERNDLRFDDLFSASNSHPILARMYMSGIITAETIILMDSVLEFLSHWQRKMENDFVWKDHAFLLDRYRPFVPKLEGEKIKQIILDRIT